MLLVNKGQTYSYTYGESSLMEETITKTTTINGQPTTENHTIIYTPGSAITLDNTTYYYVNNGHGDIKEITDTNGDTVVKYYYDAWGNLTSVTASASAAVSLDTAKKLAELNPYSYTNYHYELDLGIYYLKARYYDPVIGRFISKDPVKYENLYSYCKNNPINKEDPSGKRDKNGVINFRAVGDEEWVDKFKDDWKNAINRRFEQAYQFYKSIIYDDGNKEHTFSIKYAISEHTKWDSDDKNNTLGNELKYGLLNEVRDDIDLDNAEAIGAFTKNKLDSDNEYGREWIEDDDALIIAYKKSFTREWVSLRHEWGHLFDLAHCQQVRKCKNFWGTVVHTCFMNGGILTIIENGYQKKLCHKVHRKLLYENKKRF